ncbi:MAG: Holliday junction resolvase RuvX [Solobacterium sp.]|jgi:putative Holliday junction resolvase|nr:Holliday junction resolvase RuvX [Solobacterium sp.]
MRFLGLDLGSVTCGVAISDPLGMIARTYETVRFSENDYDTCLKRILEIIRLEQPEKIVLGLPRHMNGDVGIRGEISMEFKSMLEEETDVPVILWDERLTTKAAERILIQANVSRKKRKKVIDQMAAVQILQSYLDSM